jgi:hypothetical protein
VGSSPISVASQKPVNVNMNLFCGTPLEEGIPNSRR